MFLTQEQGYTTIGLTFMGPVEFSLPTPKVLCGNART